MRNLSVALGRRLLPNLTEDEPNKEGFRAWLDEGSYYVGPGSDPESVVLKNVNLGELVPYISFDFERFALSGLETLLFCAPEPKRPKAIGWPLLKIYYSSFFGAHAIMRATGQGVIRVEGRQARRVSEVAAIFDPALTVVPGSYAFQLVQNSDRSIDVVLRRIADSGGAHDQFWRRFYAYLSEVSSSVALAKEPDASSVVAEVTEIQSLLVSNGLSAGTWLSFVRNQINYQHGHGAWFPYGAPKSLANSVSRVGLAASSSIRLDVNSSKDPIGAFLACCRVISAINVDLSELLCRRPKAQRFGRLWGRLLSEAA